jgi:two-component system nitrogen regulation response regulator NtrX
MTGTSVLIVDDEEGLRHGLENLFKREGFTVHTAAGYESAVSAAARYPVDAAILDIRLKGDRSGIDLLLALKRLEPDLVVIVITGYGSVDTAVASLKGGAADYFLKPIDNPKLLESVRRNLELRALASENRFLKDELVQRSPHTFVTRDPALAALIARADKVKDQSVTVLITGESGTGKEVLARYIHFSGTRRDARFIGLNCAALSESLLLSELFGHERGAFTGAVERKRGKFELADGGTLFLDEIGDMSLEVQAKLLRVIEESAFERLGGVKRISVDVRIVTATNKDLPLLIREGKFREDLFYRINVVFFHLPPLRDHRGDIPLLVEHFLAKYSERYVREPVTLDPATMDALTVYDWPGNVRELENVVNRIVLLGEASFTVGSPVVVPRVLPAAPAGKEEPHVPAAGPLRAGAEEAASRYERRAISEALARNGGNKSKTARELDVTRKTLALKIARYGL